MTRCWTVILHNRFPNCSGLYVVSYYALDSKGGISPTKSAYITVTDDSAPGDVSDLGVYSESVGGLTLSWSASASLMQLDTEYTSVSPGQGRILL